ncbi:DUF1631 domain-containing protein [Pseudomonas sp. RAC1]|uniref:DUF1631 domain-containing protein n=1 Tax=Pseudomonas sp. RAC1 TaxID=3064900 RepID=UPI00272367EB|nr:DUF1631 domain-containing protein [Pseudomonas sp. RAC1]MDV9031272.1 DUF1631 domain-containing protein [Pseudomonas sp. RAC1]
MRDEGRVGPFGVTLDSRRPAPLPGLPMVLLQVRDKAALHLRQGLQALFDNADDTLFEMADKAGGGDPQHLYFEAMRDLRLKRKSIERAFLDTLHDTFLQLGQIDPLGNFDLAIGKPSRERTLAVGAMVERVLARDGFALEQLSQRFTALLDRPVQVHGNPLGPACLCRYFLDAGRELGVGQRVKLILLQLFERYVLRDVDVLYAQANQLLAAAGVLGHLAPGPRRRVEDRALVGRCGPTSLIGGPDLDADSAGQAFFASLQDLLAPRRGRLAPRVQSVAAAQAIGTADLLRLLTHLQHYLPEPVEADDFDLGQQLEQLLLRIGVRSGTRRRLATDDEDLINLIGLLFDHVRRDDNLPEALRALLVRLHLPLLKVALLDKSLFSRTSHPARRLLNEIAAMAIDWEGAGEALHARMERVIQRLLSDFDDDLQVVNDVLEEFLQFSAEERRRSELLEQRTRDAEQGRARALQARRQVQLELDRRLRGRLVPRVVQTMLMECWSQVLLLAWLKHGEGSQAWEHGLATLDALLESITVRPQPPARQRLIEQLPGLLKALRDGLAGVVLDSAVQRAFFMELERLHLRACAEPGQWQGEIDEVRIREPIILAIAEEPAGSCVPPLAAHSLQLQQVRRLRLGTWVELHDEDEPLRCKLVARVEGSDRLVFANRTGMKVREWSSAGLALALRRGEARVLDDGLLFERALEAVLEELRSAEVR